MVIFIELRRAPKIDVDSNDDTDSEPQFILGEIWLNEHYVVAVFPMPEYKLLQEKGMLPQDLDGDHEFTGVIVNRGNISSTHVIIGATATVAMHLNPGTSKSLLKG